MGRRKRTVWSILMALVVMLGVGARLSQGQGKGAKLLDTVEEKGLKVALEAVEEAGAGMRKQGEHQKRMDDVLAPTRQSS